MKLYTETQVLRMLEVCRDSDLYEHILTFEDILKTETLIEIPSDEEIEKISQDINGVDLVNICGILECKAFNRGAKWMRNKLQGGNNEQ